MPKIGRENPEDQSRCESADQERRKAEEEKLFSDTLIASIPGIFYVTDSRGRIVRWNPAYEDIFGLAAEQLPGMDGLSVIVNDDRGKPLEVLGCWLDITDRKQAEERLRASNAALQQRMKQLRTLASELTRAEQRERRRLAQILHDHLQQLLVAARLKLSIVRSELRDEARQGPEQLEQIDHTLDEAITVSRSLTAELSPRILYDAGLPAALEWLAADMEKKHGLAVKVYADPAANPAEETLREFLFQAVREGLFNVVKHAQIGHAIVRVIGLSMHEEEAAANAMREAGAVAYLTKGEDLDSLIATILG